jgi:hypothetical protein
MKNYKNKQFWEIPTTKISTETKVSHLFLGSYTNASNQLQVIRIVNLEGYLFERVMFPGQRILFEAPSNAEIEVYVGQLGQGILIEKMPVDNLLIEHPSCEQTTKEYHQFLRDINSNLFLAQE